MSSPKFKVGDKVRVKGCDVLQQTEKIAPEMLQYQKKEAVITEVFDDDGYNYTLDICEAIWYWYEDMIDLIEAAPVEEEHRPKFKHGDRVYIDGHEIAHLNGLYGTINVVYSLVGYQVIVCEHGENSYYYCEEDTLTLVPNPRFKVGDEVLIKPIADLYKISDLGKYGLKKLAARYVTITSVGDGPAAFQNGEYYEYIVQCDDHTYLVREDMIVEDDSVHRRVENDNVIYSDEKPLEEPDTLESICEHRALLRHYDGCFVTFCPRCGKILHIYHTVNLLRGYALVEGRIRELENKKGE